MKTYVTILALLISLGTCSATSAQESPKMKMTTPIPESITTPARIETRLGTLEFPQGYPTDGTAEKLYEHLDFMHGVEAFLYALPGASVHAAGRGIKSQGGDNRTVLIMERLMDSKSLFLTPNTESIYSMMWLDLKDGPLVIESPPDVLGIINDHWFHYVADVGNGVRTRARAENTCFSLRTTRATCLRGISSTAARLSRTSISGVDSSRTAAPRPQSRTPRSSPRFTRCPTSNPPPMKFIDVSGTYFNTIGGNDFSFFEDINEIVQAEPNEAYSPEILGMLAAIGIEKGKPFNPDDELKQTLTEAVAVGNPTRAPSLSSPG